MTLILVFTLGSGLLFLVALIWLFTILPEAFTASFYAWPLIVTGLLVVSASICGLGMKEQQKRCYWTAVLGAILVPFFAASSFSAWSSVGDTGLLGIMVTVLASVPVTIAGLAGCIYSAAKRAPKNSVE